MKVVAFGAEAAYRAPVLLLGGAVGVALGYAYWPDETMPWWAVALCSLVFAVINGLSWREVSGAKTAAVPEETIDDPRRTLLLDVPFAAAVVAIVAASGSGNLAAIPLGGGIATVLLAVAVRRHEARTGGTVFRGKGFRLKSSYVVARKEPAPAQRTPPHAQPEAARRAP